MNPPQSPGIVRIEKRAAPLRQQVLEALRRSIVSGGLAPGQRLIERELIEMTGVSRTVIREALRQLEAEGLIEIIPNKGPVVRELSAAEAEDLYRIRAVLEGLAARFFAETGDAAAAQALREALDAVRQAYRGTDGDQALAAKTRFYDVLYSGGSSETLASLLAMVQARIWRWRAVGLTHPKRAHERLSESVNNLSLLVSAIESGDGDLAERITREEVSRAAEEVMRLIAAEEETTD
ncbi:MAG: GntR family transcriptional regulator [Gammaproteobacteria bacterium]|nr:GntR family transcriptional regulator [Gammaproteobacteria bacterium]